MKKLNIDEDSWLCGFFEGQTSFAVNIGLTKTKNKRYVIFKPYVVIANTDRYQIEFVIKQLKLRSGISKKWKEKEYYNDCFSLNIQNFADIDIILDKIMMYDFKSKSKYERIVRFMDCYEKIKELGHIHTAWDNRFVDIIEKKLDINKQRSNIDKKRIGKDEWIKRIKEHLLE